MYKSREFTLACLDILGQLFGLYIYSEDYTIGLSKMVHLAHFIYFI